ncbi:MAG: hypothetical protein R2744_01910 [Bacteroidales bacterium]
MVQPQPHTFYNLGTEEETGLEIVLSSTWREHCNNIKDSHLMMPWR